MSLLGCAVLELKQKLFHFFLTFWWSFNHFFRPTAGGSTSIVLSPESGQGPRLGRGCLESLQGLRIYLGSQGYHLLGRFTRHLIGQTLESCSLIGCGVALYRRRELIQATTTNILLPWTMHEVCFGLVLMAAMC